MNSYFFSVPIIGSYDEDEYVIFAPERHQAQLMLTYFATEELNHSGWTGEDWEKFEFSGRDSELETAKKQNKAGLGVYVLGEGWKIVSLNEMRTSRYLE